MGQPTLDPEEFLKRLKQEHRVLQWEPLPPDLPRRPMESSPNTSRDSLEYLHANWSNLPHSYDGSGSGDGIRGKVIGLFGRLTFRVLGPYLHKERELLAHVVRANENLERRCDELAIRCQQLRDDMLHRQSDEARNQAKLALWLNLEPPVGATPPPPLSANGSADPDTPASRE